MVSRTLLEFQFDYDSYKEEGSTLFSFILFQSIFECVRKQSWMNMLSLLNVSHSILAIKSFMFSSVTQSCLTLCNPMDRSMPGIPAHHQLPRLIHVYQVGDAIQSSHPLLSPSLPTFNLSQHQGLF